MTEQTSTCRQPAKLEWNGNGDWAYTTFDMSYQIHNYGEGKYEAYCVVDEISDYIGKYPTQKLAQAACQADYDRKWTEGSEPSPFWKPIEQCPKVEGIFYLLRSPSGTPFIGTIGYDELGYYWAVGLDKEPIDFYTHFAEIQACEVQP